MGVVHKAEVISFPKWYNPEMEAKHWRSKWLKHLDYQSNETYETS